MTAMTERMVRIETFEQLRDFVHKCCQIDANIVLSSGKHVANAKSLMGVLSMYLGKSVIMIIYAERDSREVKKCDELLSDYYCY